MGKRRVLVIILPFNVFTATSCSPGIPMISVALANRTMPNAPCPNSFIISSFSLEKLKLAVTFAYKSSLALTTIGSAVDKIRYLCRVTTKGTLYRSGLTSLTSLTSLPVLYFRPFKTRHLQIKFHKKTETAEKGLHPIFRS